MASRGVLLAVVAALLGPAATPAAAAGSAPDPGAPVVLGGAPVDVSTNPADPTPLEAGLWADTLTGPGSVEANTHRFRYERTMADSSVLVAVVAVSSEATADQVAVSVTPAGEPGDCGSDSESPTSTVPGAPFGTGVVVASESRDDVCVRAPALDIAVSRGSADLGSDLPVAIRIVEEARPVDLESLPEPAEVLAPPVPEPGDPRPATGTASFADVPELEPGTVSVALREGESQVFRVPLGWGESLTTRVDVPALTEAEREALAYQTPTVELVHADPLRNTFADWAEDAVTSAGQGLDRGTLYDTVPPVGYRNRFADRSATVPGDYFVVLSVSPTPEAREPVEVPVEMTVVVEDEGAGGPGFPASVQGAGGAAAPVGYDPATPYVVEEGVFSADVSGTPRVPGADGSSSTRRTAGLVVGGAGLVSLLLGVLLLRRRSRFSRAAAS